MRIFPRGTQVAAGRERLSGVNPSPSAGMHRNRMTHAVQTCLESHWCAFFSGPQR